MKNLRLEIEKQIADNSQEEIAVSLELFFEGNNDLGSIGCNLGEEQPEISKFYKTLKEIRERDEVQDVLVRVFDLQDLEEWPFTDAVYIISKASINEVKDWVSCLLPDEVIPDWMYGKPKVAPNPVKEMIPYSVWWD